MDIANNLIVRSNFCFFTLSAGDISSSNFDKLELVSIFELRFSCDGDLLNVLFGSSNDSSSKKEILILLTPTLVQ
jgi:hypothetical protein